MLEFTQQNSAGSQSLELQALLKGVAIGLDRGSCMKPKSDERPTIPKWTYRGSGAASANEKLRFWQVPRIAVVQLSRQPSRRLPA